MTFWNFKRLFLETRFLEIVKNISVSNQPIAVYVSLV